MNAGKLSALICSSGLWKEQAQKGKLKKKKVKEKKSKNNIDFQPPKNVSEQKQLLTVIRF